MTRDLTRDRQMTVSILLFSMETKQCKNSRKNCKKQQQFISSQLFSVKQKVFKKKKKLLG